MLFLACKDKEVSNETRAGTKTRTAPTVTGQTAFWLCLLLTIMSPINSVAGGSDFAFSPTEVNLAVVVGTETANQDVTITNVSGKALAISGITIEIGPGFSESNNCLTEIKAGGSCTMRVAFTPLSSGGRNGIANAIFIIDVGGTEVACLDAHGQAL
jgi:hypothetical protein